LVSLFSVFFVVAFSVFLSYRPLLYYPIFLVLSLLYYFWFLFCRWHFLLFVLLSPFTLFAPLPTPFFVAFFCLCCRAYICFCSFGCRLFLFFILSLLFCFFVDVSFVSSFLGGGSIAGCRVLCVGSSIGPVADADKFLSSRAKNLAV
jgi:hypothetical protein